jgi:aspartyl-tRNA(Asn)/glutamyl-tRNA(Gln) amidotransferase subunit B
MPFEPIIGLEVHVQLKTQSKMFCRCANKESDKPNVNICEVCTGQPGVLPVANQEAIRKAIMVGLALNCEVASVTKFDRKNYFYPDLPKGYQISQFDMPINGKGHLEININNEVRRIGITRAHLEEDAGKLIHSPSGYSLVDYNRTSVPLLEIVGEPEIKTPEEAKVYLQELQNLMRYLSVSNADMEKGHLRCDANISLRKVGETRLPDYKVEVKNMNSFRAVVSALEFEIQRQTKALDDGEKLTSETRGWVDAKGITVSQRSKEDSQDYRYFPEPDLPEIHLSSKYVEEIRRELPELPIQRKARLISEYSLSDKDAQVLVFNKDLADYFEQVISELQEWWNTEGDKDSDNNKEKVFRLAANWVIGQFSALLNENKTSPKDCKITPENFAELIKLIGQGKVSQLSAKDVFAKMFETGEDPSNLLDSLGLAQVSDTGAISEIVKKIIGDNPKAVEDVHVKGERAFGFLVGLAMKELKGKGNPQMINELLKKELGI